MSRAITALDNYVHLALSPAIPLKVTLHQPGVPTRKKVAGIKQRVRPPRSRVRIAAAWVDALREIIPQLVRFGTRLAIVTLDKIGESAGMSDQFSGSNRVVTRWRRSVAMESLMQCQQALSMIRVVAGWH